MVVSGDTGAPQNRTFGYRRNQERTRNYHSAAKGPANSALHLHDEPLQWVYHGDHEEAYVNNISR